MKTVLKHAALLGCLVQMTGCALLEPEMTESSKAAPTTDIGVIDITSVNVVDDPDGTMLSVQEEDAYFGVPGQPPLYSSLQGAYKGHPLTKHIGDYVKNMTQDLVSNMDYVTQATPVGVTHFALLDSNLQHTNLLGRQMAESFIHEMHKFKIPVIDFKATNYIRVTPDGDFVLTRDYLELDNAAQIQYVLTGTLAKHQGGYMVNARIVGINSHVVVATAQTLVPFYVVDALIPSDEMDTRVDGIRLTDGNSE